MYSMTPVKESRMTRNRSTALGIDDHDKDLLKVLRYLYKPTDPKTLTGEALEACQLLGVKPVTLQPKTLEEFVEKEGEPTEVVQVRLNHYMTKRKRKLARF